MTNEKKISNDNQYTGDKELEDKVKKETDPSGSETVDESHSSDTENRKGNVDEADVNSNAGPEARRTRADFSENPSKDK